MGKLGEMEGTMLSTPLLCSREEALAILRERGYKTKQKAHFMR